MTLHEYNHATTHGIVERHQDICRNTMSGYDGDGPISKQLQYLEALVRNVGAFAMHEIVYEDTTEALMLYLQTMQRVIDYALLKV